MRQTIQAGPDYQGRSFHFASLVWSKSLWTPVGPSFYPSQYPKSESLIQALSGLFTRPKTHQTKTHLFYGYSEGNFERGPKHVTNGSCHFKAVPQISAKDLGGMGL